MNLAAASSMAAGRGGGTFLAGRAGNSATMDRAMSGAEAGTGNPSLCIARGSKLRDVSNLRRDTAGPRGYAIAHSQTHWMCSCTSGCEGAAACTSIRWSA